MFWLKSIAAVLGLGMMVTSALPSLAAEDDPELIFKKSTVFRLLSPNAKLAVYALDDPLVEGVACHFTVPEIGGWKGWAGFAEERSEVLRPGAPTAPGDPNPQGRRRRSSSGAMARS